MNSAAPTNSPAMLMQEVQVGSLRPAGPPVLSGVNWSVASGEFWVVAGLAQTGKTDLLMLAGGLVPPLTGSYRLFGRDLRELGEAGLAERLQVAFVPDHGQMFSQLTIAENIALPLRYQRNLDAEEAVREILGLLEMLELLPFAGAWPASLSRDWLKRAALARALVLRPRVLLCDHPLGGLGIRHRRWWLQFLDQLWHGHEYFGGTPMTVVVTTAELAPWQHAGRRFALLRDGQFLPLGAWSEVIQSADPTLGELLTQAPQPTL